MKCLIILMLMTSYALACADDLVESIKDESNNDDDDDVIMTMLKQIRQNVAELNAKTDFLQATVDYLRTTNEYLEATSHHLKVTVAGLAVKVHDIEYDLTELKNHKEEVKCFDSKFAEIQQQIADLSIKEQGDYDKLQADVTALNRNVEENCKNQTMCCQQLRDEIEALTNNKTTTTTSSETTAAPTTAATCGPLNNGYNYEWVDTEYSWNQARTNCQRKGGDLAHHGLDTLDGREQLICGYFNLCDNGKGDSPFGLEGSESTEWLFIGLTRDTTTGMFKYLDGEDAPFDDQLWFLFGDYNDAGQDCAYLLGIEHNDPNFLQAYSFYCDRFARPSICEIKC